MPRHDPRSLSHASRRAGPLALLALAALLAITGKPAAARVKKLTDDAPLGGGTSSLLTLWSVPGDGSNGCSLGNPNCNTIQAAINAASAGDTIGVAAGVYPECLVLGKKL